MFVLSVTVGVVSASGVVIVAVLVAAAVSADVSEFVCGRGGIATAVVLEVCCSASICIELLRWLGFGLGPWSSSSCSEVASATKASKTSAPQVARSSCRNRCTNCKLCSCSCVYIEQSQNRLTNVVCVECRLMSEATKLRQHLGMKCR